MNLGIACRGKGDIPSLRNFISLISVLKANCRRLFPPLSPSITLLSLSLSFCTLFSGAQPFHFPLLSTCFPSHQTVLSSLENCSENDVMCVCAPKKMLMVRTNCVCICIIDQSAICFSVCAYGRTCLCTVTALEAKSKCSAFNKSHNQQSGSKQ